MTDYSKMSDFEINVAVLKLTAYYDEISPLSKIGSPVVAWGDGANWHEFDACNSGKDAWPIIENHDIGIKKQTNGQWVATQPGGEYPQYHKQPLRAAMIVFLMMKDAENAPAI